MMEYTVWHDEYKGDDSVNDYWHGILLLPKNKYAQLCEDLRAVREECGVELDKDIKFAGSLNSVSRSRMLKIHLAVFLHMLCVREDKVSTELINPSLENKYKNGYKPFHVLEGLYGCKFVLLKIPGNHADMDKYELSYSDRVERTFRFAFKSAAHGLFDTDIQFINFYFDGHQHHGRNIDIQEITKGPWREHIQFSPDLEIDDRQIDDRNDDTKLVMNLVDNVLGALTAKIVGTPDERRALSGLDELIDRVQNNQIITNKYSRWHKAVNMSQMFVEDDGFDFKDIFHYPEQTTLGF